MFRTSPQRVITATELVAALKKQQVEYFPTLAIGETLGFAKAEMEAVYSKSVCGPDISSYLIAVPSYWQTFWNELGLELDVSVLCIPERREGFNSLLVMPKGATANFLYEACSKLFPCSRYADNLDAITSDRDPGNGAYAIWVRDRAEADDELKVLTQAGAKHITLAERLALELKYFKETGKHLDMNNATFCAGSRDSRLGTVLYVHWDAKNNRMNVDWYEPGTPINYGFSRLRARAVIA